MQLNIVDLYAGAGGLSLGLQLAGHKVVKAVEIDEWAAQTYSENLGNDIECTSVHEFLETGADFKGVDAVVGGPPCQGFSISSKNRKVGHHDPRNDELFNFVRAVEIFKPRMLLFENVPQFKTFRGPDGRRYYDLLIGGLSNLHYDLYVDIINAANFGVPQARQRFFIVGLRRVTGKEGPVIGNLSALMGGFTTPIMGAWDAISDLPEVFPRQLTEDAVLAYKEPPRNFFQKEMRKHATGIFNHIPMRHSDRLVSRFSKIGVGMNGTSVWNEDASMKRGSRDEVGVQFEQNHRRIDGAKPAPTIAAHMYSTCLHPIQNRNITIREAARFQSFPDHFRFYGKRTTLSRKLLERKGLFEDQKLSQLNQVGNAVPPLLARVLGEVLSKLAGGDNAKRT